jgi:hypothetical protein
VTAGRGRTSSNGSRALFRAHHGPSPSFSPGPIALPASLAFAAATVLAACSGSDAGAAVTRSDSAGVEIIISHREDRLLDWTFTPATRIGGADSGAASFYEISASQIATDSAGRIYVLDRQAFRVSAFDREGAALWSAGREGGAPGEFKVPFSVRVTGDTVQVLDGGGPELEWFRTTDGAHLGNARLDRFTARVARTRFGMLAEHGEREQGRDPRDILSLVRGADTLVLASVIQRVVAPLEFEDCEVRVLIPPQPPVLTPELHWAASAEHAFVATSAEYRIDVWRDTSVIRSIRRAVDPVPVTPEVVEEELPDGRTLTIASRGITCRMSAAEVVERVGHARVVPAVRALLLAPDNTLWVRRNPPRQALGTFDLFTADGEYVGTLRDAPVPAAFLPDGSVVGIEKDELDIERVVIYEVSQG